MATEYRVTNPTMFSRPTKDVVGLRKAMNEAKRMASGAQIRDGERLVAVVRGRDVYTGNSKDSFGGRRGVTVAYLVAPAPHATTEEFRRILNYTLGNVCLPSDSTAHPLPEQV